MNHYGQHPQAAQQFAAAAGAAQTTDFYWAAHFHEAYALWHGGEREKAAPLLHEVIAAGEPAGAWAERAQALLDHSG
jgi:hypothetical protein